VKLKSNQPSIKDQFKDLKRSLSSLSQKDWENIPEMQDYTVKKQKRDKYTPLSDNLLNRALNESQVNTQINVTNPDGKANGFVTGRQLVQHSQHQ